MDVQQDLTGAQVVYGLTGKVGITGDFSFGATDVWLAAVPLFTRRSTLISEYF